LSFDPNGLPDFPTDFWRLIANAASLGADRLDPPFRPIAEAAAEIDSYSSGMMIIKSDSAE
jgi:hypothetical protein